MPKGVENILGGEWFGKLFQTLLLFQEIFQKMGTSSVGPSSEKESRDMFTGHPMTAETNAEQPLPVADPNVSKKGLDR